MFWADGIRTVLCLYKHSSPNNCKNPVSSGNLEGGVESYYSMRSTKAHIGKCKNNYTHQGLHYKCCMEQLLQSLMTELILKLCMKHAQGMLKCLILLRSWLIKKWAKRWSWNWLNEMWLLSPVSRNVHPFKSRVDKFWVALPTQPRCLCFSQGIPLDCRAVCWFLISMWFYRNQGYCRVVKWATVRAVFRDPSPPLFSNLTVSSSFIMRSLKP